MVDFLRLNGVPVSVAAGAAELRPELVGEEGRSVDGSLFVQRTAIKRVYDCSTTPQTPQEALALEGLLHGKGHVWPFTAARGLYSSRGALVTSSGAAITRAAAFGKFGSDSAQVPNGVTLRTNVLYPTVAGSSGNAEPTLSFWLSLDGSTWSHRAYRAGIGQWYTNGVAGSGPAGVPITYSASFGWQIGNATGANLWVDDLWVCPYDWPATWPAFVFGYNLAVGLAPYLRADGLAIGNNLVTVDAAAVVTSMPLLPGAIGSYTANLQSLGFTLSEV
jgi:hypothetical protein